MAAEGAPVAPFAVQVKPTTELTPAEHAAIYDLVTYSFNDDFPERGKGGHERPSDVYTDAVTVGLADQKPRVGGMLLRRGQALEDRFTVIISAPGLKGAQVPASELRPTGAVEGDTTLPEGHGLLALASFSVNASSKSPTWLGRGWRLQHKMANPNDSFIANGLYVATPSAKEILHSDLNAVTPFDAMLVKLHSSGVYGVGDRRVTSYPYTGHGGGEETLVRNLHRLGILPTGEPRTETLGTTYLSFRQQRHEGPTLANIVASVLARPGAREMLANMYGIQT